MTSQFWLTDTAFVNACRKREYLGKDNSLHMAAGIYLYLHELCTDGIQHGAMTTIEDWRVVLEYWQAQGKDIRFLEIPPELATKLGVPLSVTKKQLPLEEDEDDMPRGRKKAVQIELPHVQAAIQQNTQGVQIGLAEGAVMDNFKWKRRKEFDGTTCGHVDCNHVSSGYVLGIRSTKEGKNGQIWFGPACVLCIRKYHSSLNPITLAELAHQRNGASDLALVLDVEVGEVLKRLDTAGIDEKGQAFNNTQQPPQYQQQQPLQGMALVPAAPLVTAEGGVENRNYNIAVVVPTASIADIQGEAQGTLAALQQFDIFTQEQMDYASNYVQRAKGLWKVLEEQRKAIGKPFSDIVVELQKPFKLGQRLLVQVEETLKNKIDEAYVRSGATKQAAYGQAEAALASGDMQGVAVATQQAAAADISLSQGISRRTNIRFEVINPALVPQELCSWVPDLVKIQWAIDQGYYQLGDGIRIWEEGTIAARAVAP